MTKLKYLISETSVLIQPLKLNYTEWSFILTQILFYGVEAVHENRQVYHVTIGIRYINE